MNPILQLIGPTLVFLFFAGYLSLCLFGNMLDELHERWTNSRFAFFMLPGKLKDADFYIRFYKVLCGLLLSVVTLCYVGMVVVVLKG